jgi:hypothetical protein
MPEECGDLLPDQTLLIRGVRHKEINQQTRKIKKYAFVPRRNGQDDDGLSVSQPANDSRGELMKRLSNLDGLFCKLQAGQVRMIAEGVIRLDVCPSPTKMDPYHALIKGVPTTKEEVAIATRLAEKLAAIASEYTPPLEV